MGFKNDVAGELQELNRRVGELENLAASLRPGALPVRNVSTIRPESAAVRAATRVETRDPIDGASVGRTTGVDYGAVAFGLAEIKRNVATALNGAGVSIQTLNSKYEGTVQYFADVFAKSDPQFNAAEFVRLANA